MAQAAADAPSLTLPQPTFTAVPSTTAFGPPADIAPDWDGTLWAIDASGGSALPDSFKLGGSGAAAVNSNRALVSQTGS